jgi:hypothetical protein
MRLRGNWLIKADQQESRNVLTRNNYCHQWQEVCREMHKVSPGPGISHSRVFQTATIG